MVHVMNMVIVVVMMVMVVMHLSGRRRLAGGRRCGARRWGGRRCFLRHCVAGEAERKNGRGGKGLDHERTILWLGKPKWVAQNDRDLRLNSI
jgi:hypothetical protein